MSRLEIYAEQNPATPLSVTTDPAAIAVALAAIGVRFERWQADAALADDADDAAVLTAYAPEIARLRSERGYAAVDIVRMAPDHPDRAVLRRKFLSEHRHGEDEVRFFVEGEGLFTLREHGRIYNMLCTRDDLISVPAGIRHWFDMGPAPRFAAIRLFTNPDGWVAHFTGDDIADRFPRHEPVAA